MGDYEGARYLHFFAMAAVVLIVAVHVVMVALVPRTFPTMLTGRREEGVMIKNFLAASLAADREPRAAPVPAARTARSAR